ncbi:response regulator transcription factor [Marinobacterium arenosum]|uniref:response regulator transcription factor n=1 Tax=Marinobacterium arenosum TaxID=2862496 RepID=UPI001C93B5DE|nr:response regulator [Marinobacterium arenosum]MBY4678488.1 response regulator [Marinobacterium arenosum]
MARILIVDDEPQQLKLLQGLLIRRPLEVLACQDGQLALAQARLLQPELILLDVRMPGMDGYQVCSELKRDPGCRHIPVIFLSAADRAEERVRGFEVGAVDYVTKPYFAEELYARIGLHLEMSRRIRLAVPAGEPPGLEGGDREQELISAAVDILEQSVAAPPALADLAHQIGTNEQTLNRLFKERLGMTVFSFLRERRLQYACEWLEDTEMPLQSIAERIGYRSSANFITAFKERFGLTPKQYRARGQGEE